MSSSVVAAAAAGSLRKDLISITNPTYQESKRFTNLPNADVYHLVMLNFLDQVPSREAVALFPSRFYLHSASTHKSEYLKFQCTDIIGRTMVLLYLIHFRV